MSRHLAWLRSDKGRLLVLFFFALVAEELLLGVAYGPDMFHGCSDGAFAGVLREREWKGWKKSRRDKGFLCVDDQNNLTGFLRSPRTLFLFLKEREENTFNLLLVPRILCCWKKKIIYLKKKMKNL